MDEKRRLDELNRFELSFQKALAGTSESPQFTALAHTIKERNLTLQHFLDLLSAFNQDVVKKRYSTHDEVLDYCRRSANPVGRLLLELLGVRQSIPLLYSDKICTALQLTNFLQDIKTDFGKGRIYIPVDELERNSVSGKDFHSNETPEQLKKVVKENIELVRNMFLEGRNLIPYLPGLFKIEIKWTVAGGERILLKIEKSGFNVLTNRQKLDKLDFIIIFFKSFLSV